MLILLGNLIIPRLLSGKGSYGKSADFKKSVVFPQSYPQPVTVTFSNTSGTVA
jgi:hypothetical protein